MNRELLTRQRNQLFRLLERSCIHTDLFSALQESGKYQITASDSYWLSIEIYSDRNNEDAYNMAMRPGIRAGEMVSTYRADEWQGVINDFKKWLGALHKEMSAPDLWAEASRTAQLFAGIKEFPDDAEVKRQLGQLHQSIASSALPEAARNTLIELTTTASLKADSLTKKDWQNWIIGGFISSKTALALNPTQAQEVLKLVKAAFGGLFLH